MDVSNSFQALCWNFLLLLFACCRSCGQIYPCLESHSVLNATASIFYYFRYHTQLWISWRTSLNQRVRSRFPKCRHALSKWQPHNQMSKVKCKEQKGEGSLHSLIWWQCEGLLIQTLIVHIAEGCPAESWCLKTTETPHPSCPLVRVDEICCHDKLLVPSLTVAEFLTVASPWRGRRTGLHQTCGQSSRCIRKRDQARLYSLCTNQ